MPLNPHPAGTLVPSRGTEEDATFASQSAHQLERSVAAYRVLFGCELWGPYACCGSVGSMTGSRASLGDAVALVADLPRNDEDRDLRGDIAAAASLLDDLGRLVPVGGWP